MGKKQTSNFGPTRQDGYVWIYLIGFGDNKVKAGISIDPVSRVKAQRGLGKFNWVHFAGTVKSSHWVVMEAAVLRALDDHGRRFSPRHEVFNGITREAAIQATRVAMQRMRETYCNDKNIHYMTSQERIKRAA